LRVDRGPKTARDQQRNRLDSCRHNYSALPS
jgi:hypothetical protein